MPITRIAEIPFPRLAAHVLLHVDDPERLSPDLTFAGFGHGVVGPLELAAPRQRSIVLERALVLALHTSEIPPPDASEIELEFELETEDEQLTSVLVPLDGFLAVKLPTLLGCERDVVLALCNPLRLAPARPAVLGERTLHYAWGDVLSWLDRDAWGGEQFRLSADAWHHLGSSREDG